MAAAKATSPTPSRGSWASSARSLRGEKMEDVIFSGSDARKPTATAEVRLRLSGVTGLAEAEETVVEGTNGKGHGNGHGNGNGHGLGESALLAGGALRAEGEDGALRAEGLNGAELEEPVEAFRPIGRDVEL